MKDTLSLKDQIDAARAKIEAARGSGRRADHKIDQRLKNTAAKREYRDRIRGGDA